MIADQFKPIEEPSDASDLQAENVSHAEPSPDFIWVRSEHYEDLLARGLIDAYHLDRERSENAKLWDALFGVIFIATTATLLAAVLAGYYAASRF